MRRGGGSSLGSESTPARVGRPGFLTPEGELQAEQMAARAWCTAREARRLRTKPECALESVAKELWYASLLRIRIDDRRRRIGLVFWVQRHRYWTLDRAELLGYVRNRLLRGWVGPAFSP